MHHCAECWGKNEVNNYDKWPGKDVFSRYGFKNRNVNKPFEKKSVRGFDKCMMLCKNWSYINTRFGNTSEQNYDVFDQNCISAVCKRTNHDLSFPYMDDNPELCTECWDKIDVADTASFSNISRFKNDPKYVEILDDVPYHLDVYRKNTSSRRLYDPLQQFRKGACVQNCKYGYYNSHWSSKPYRHNHHNTNQICIKDICTWGNWDKSEGRFRCHKCYTAKDINNYTNYSGKSIKRHQLTYLNQKTPYHHNREDYICVPMCQDNFWLASEHFCLATYCKTEVAIIEPSNSQTTVSEKAVLTSAYCQCPDGESYLLSVENNTVHDDQCENGYITPTYEEEDINYIMDAKRFNKVVCGDDQAIQGSKVCQDCWGWDDIVTINEDLVVGFQSDEGEIYAECRCPSGLLHPIRGDNCDDADLNCQGGVLTICKEDQTIFKYDSVVCGEVKMKDDWINSELFTLDEVWLMDKQNPPYAYDKETGLCMLQCSNRAVPIHDGDPYPYKSKCLGCEVFCNGCEGTMNNCLACWEYDHFRLFDKWNIDPSLVSPESLKGLNPKKPFS